MEEKMCPVCKCPMSKINPTTCQNCDYKTNWTQDHIDSYQQKLCSDIEYEDGFCDFE